MFDLFIKFLKKDINAFISKKKGVNDDFVLFTNLNNIIENRGSIDNKIIISIVGIEEEKLLKSPDNYVATQTEVTYKKPPVWLNLVCVFTYFTASNENYDGIDLLAHVVQYFQSRPRIDKTSAVVTANFPSSLEAIRAELVSLNFEQSNYLWGLLGGKYHPSVVYRFKSIQVDNLDLTPGGPPIQKDKITVRVVHKKD